MHLHPGRVLISKFWMTFLTSLLVMLAERHRICASPLYYTMTVLVQLPNESDEHKLQWLLHYTHVHHRDGQDYIDGAVCSARQLDNYKRESRRSGMASMRVAVDL